MIENNSQITTVEEAQRVNQMKPNTKEYRIEQFGKLIREVNPLVVNLKVPYNNPKILFEKSPELEFVNSFFESITCGDKGIENLLYEMIGYCLAKTAKLSKAFILKR